MVSISLDQVKETRHNTCDTQKGRKMVMKKRAKKQKYPQRKVLTTRNPAESRAFYDATDDQAPLSDRQLAAGHIQHPDTGWYQLWLSTNGLDVTLLAAYRDRARADSALEELKAFLGTPDVYDTEKCAALFGKLQQAGDGEPRALPDDLVRQIARQILRRVVDGPRL